MKIKDETIDQVKDIRYKESLITGNGESIEDRKRGISIAKRAFKKSNNYLQTRTWIYNWKKL